MTESAGFHVDPGLACAWPLPDQPPVALTAAGHCVLAVTAEPMDEAAHDDVRRALATALAGPTGLTGPAGPDSPVDPLDVLLAHGRSLRAVLRSWVDQAAAGTGRGVHITTAEAGDGLLVRLDSPDSSAREAVLRLAGDADAVNALARALGYARVCVREAHDTAYPPR